ncbi:hypothetical protein BGZ73_002942 [Actinomortierella ambigua]|nr:hypothetical protein BGZ73_002942 [Actinomortierella ambigua]
MATETIYGTGLPYQSYGNLASRPPPSMMSSSAPQNHPLNVPPPISKELTTAASFSSAMQKPESNDRTTSSNNEGAYNAAAVHTSRRHQHYPSASSSGPQRTGSTAAAAVASGARAGRYSPRSQPYRVLQQADGRRISATSAYLLQQQRSDGRSYPSSSSSSSSKRVPSSRSKAHKRVSKALPPDPRALARQQQQQQQLLEHLQTQKQKRNMHVSKELPPPPPPSHSPVNTTSLHPATSDAQVPSLAPPLQQHKHSLAPPRYPQPKSEHPPPSRNHQEETVQQLPPSAPQKSSGGRIKIDHPYSFYNYETSATLQSVTLIQSPFDSAPTTPARPPPDNHTDGPPTAINMLASVPAAIQPAPMVFQEGERHDPMALQTIPARDSSKTARKQQLADENPSKPIHHPDPYLQNTHPNRPIPQQPQQQYHHQQQHQPEHQRHQYPSHTYQPQTDSSSASHPPPPATRSATAPSRKVSGTKIMRMARQASEGALRSVGLNRKPSDKALAAAKASVAHDSGAPQGNVIDSIAHRARNMSEYPQQPPFRALERNASHTSRYPADGQQQQQQPLRERAASPTVMDRAAHQYVMDKAQNYQGYPQGVELSRKQSMPEFRSRTADPAAGRGGTGRGMSLNHPKPSNAGMVSHQPTLAEVQEDAYGGTTDDWRQTLQAKNEAAARHQNGDEVSQAARESHISLNSVSTLNLPPQVNVEGSMANVTLLAPPSASRILLPDRDSGNNIGQQKHLLQQQQLKQQQEHLQQYRQHQQYQQHQSQQQQKHHQEQEHHQKQQQHHQQQQQQQQHEDPRSFGNVQRSNTAPYPSRETKTIAEEDELESVVIPALAYSKSEGSVPRSKRPQQQQHQHQPPQQHQHESQPQPQPQPQQPRISVEDQSETHVGTKEEVDKHDTHEREKDLPPTPTRTPSPLNVKPNRPPGATADGASHHATQHGQLHAPQPVAAASHAKSRIESSPSPHHHHHPKTNDHEPTTTSALASTLERSLNRSTTNAHGNNSSHDHQHSNASLPPQLPPLPHSLALLSSSTLALPLFSHNRNNSVSQTNSSQTQLVSASSAAGSTTSLTSGSVPPAGRFGLNMVPLPVIPSPDEALSNKPGVGVLPQDVLRSLDPKMIQKLITQSVIASRVYKVLSFEEVASLQKEKEDLESYIVALKASLTIEMRMRDASHSLIRLHESNTNIDAVKASTSQLHATTRKVDQIVAKLHQAAERLLVLDRTLLQHEAATLNAGMRRLDAENRELSRLVLELEKERDHEKAERVRWQKQHTQLRIQSMIFPSPPGVDEEDLEQLSDMIAKHQQQQEQQQQQQQQQRQQEEENKPSSSSTLQVPNVPVTPTSDFPAFSRMESSRLRALEDYMKELNEEIAKKDEHVSTLETQLKRVDDWVGDFEESIQARFPASQQQEKEQGEERSKATSTDGQEKEASEKKNKKNKDKEMLDQRLQKLRLHVDDVCSQLAANAAKADEERMHAVEFAATTLANSQEQQQQLILAHQRRIQRMQQERQEQLEQQHPLQYQLQQHQQQLQQPHQPTIARRSLTNGPSARRQQYEEGILLRRASTRPARPQRGSQPQMQRKRSSTVGGSGADFEASSPSSSSSNSSDPSSSSNGSNGSSGSHLDINSVLRDSLRELDQHIRSVSPSSSVPRSQHHHQQQQQQHRYGGGNGHGHATATTATSSATHQGTPPTRSNSDSGAERYRRSQTTASTLASVASVTSSASSSSWGGSSTTTEATTTTTESLESESQPLPMIAPPSTPSSQAVGSVGAASKDELLIGDAHAEILRLNAMVDELERLVRLRMQD